MLELNGRKIDDYEIAITERDGCRVWGHFYEATYADTGEQLSDEELDKLSEDYPEVISEYGFEQALTIADCYGD